MIYIKEFSTVADANSQAAAGLDSPHIDYVIEKSAVNIYKAQTDTFTCTFDENGKIVIPTPTQPNDEIWYSTVNGDAVTVVVEDAFGSEYIGPTLVSHIAPKDNSGKGIIKFAEPITKLGYVDAEFTQFYPVISPESEGAIITSFSLPSSLYYLGYGSILYCQAMSVITIPDSVTELWVFPNYEPIGADAACPFLESRIYDEDTGEAIGGVKKFITSKGEFAWRGKTMNDYAQVTLGNGSQYKIVDIIGL